MTTNLLGVRFVARFGKQTLSFRITQTCATKTLCLPLSTSASQNVTQGVTRKLIPNEGFWKKNERMERPVSPHLTIYRFPLPAMLSGSHRFTGLAMSGMTMIVGVGALVLPGPASSYIEMIQALNLPIWLIAPCKAVVVWPFVYHALNGIRHLLWDTGRGFQMPVIYKTGYLVLGTSVAIALGIVAYVLQ